MYIFEVQKWPLFAKGEKNRILCHPKRSSLITFIFELLFDTATLIMPSFRMMSFKMIKARCCE